MVFLIYKLNFKVVKDNLCMVEHQKIQSILKIINKYNSKKINKKRNSKLNNYINFLITLKID